MKVAGIVGAVLVLSAVSAVGAEELKSGIPVDGRMPKYKSIKCGGGDDGVELGKSLCYT